MLLVFYWIRSSGVEAANRKPGWRKNTSFCKMAALKDGHIGSLVSSAQVLTRDFPSDIPSLLGMSRGRLNRAPKRFQACVRLLCYLGRAFHFCTSQSDHLLRDFRTLTLSLSTTHEDPRVPKRLAVKFLLVVERTTHKLLGSEVSRVWVKECQ
jgi:hypothetical protein